MNTLSVPRPADPLDAAVLYFANSQVALAKAIGYSASAVTAWRVRGFIPKRAKLAIAQATRGAVTEEELRSAYPDTPNQ